ncbi:MAG: Branched-chain amino acid transport system permease protein LivM, partial [uncultured Microvirga sp.]
GERHHRHGRCGRGSDRAARTARGARAPSHDLRRLGRPPSGRALRGLSGLRDEGAVLRAVRLRLQPSARLWWSPLLRPRRVFRHGELCLGLHGETLGHHARDRDPARNGRFSRPGPCFRRAGDPPPGHLLRHDHPGARPDGLLLLAPDPALHGRRGRHPGGAARQPFRPGQPRRRPGALLPGRGHLLRRAAADLPHHPLALRPGSKGDPGQRAARDLAGVSNPSIQARRVRAVGLARRRRRGHEGDRVPARLAHRRALVDVGRGGSDDARRRHGDGVWADRRRARGRGDAELSRLLRILGPGHPGCHLRGLRAPVPRRHRRRHRQADRPAAV